MSREFRSTTRWCLSAGSSSRCPVNRVSVDEIDQDLETLARHRFKTSEENKSDFLVEKFKGLNFEEQPQENCDFQSFAVDSSEYLPEAPRTCETFTDISMRGQNCPNRLQVNYMRCTQSQSVGQLTGKRPEKCQDSLQSYSRFSNPSCSSGECDHGMAAMATGLCRIDDLMEDDLSELSWNPAVLRRISSPRLSKDSFHSDEYRMHEEDIRLTASDSDSVSRVSFLLDEDHMTYGHRKTQSMTNFLDLNSENASSMNEGELNMSCNNACDRVFYGDEENGDDKSSISSPIHKSARYADNSVRESTSYSSDADIDIDISTILMTYNADVSDNVPSDEQLTSSINQTQSPVSGDSVLDTPNEEKALTRNSLGRHDGDVLRDYQRSKSLDALRKRKRGRVAAIRQSAITVASHVFGVFRRVKSNDSGTKSPGKHKSPRKIKEQKNVKSSPSGELFNIQNASIVSSASSSEYELN